MADNDHGQDDNEGQGKGTQEYVVKVNFTDAKGKQWAAGTVFSGDEAAVKKALAAGQIAARPKATLTA